MTIINSQVSHELDSPAFQEDDIYNQPKLVDNQLGNFSQHVFGLIPTDLGADRIQLPNNGMLIYGRELEEETYDPLIVETRVTSLSPNGKYKPDSVRYETQLLTTRRLEVDFNNPEIGAFALVSLGMKIGESPVGLIFRDYDNEGNMIELTGHDKEKPISLRRVMAAHQANNMYFKSVVSL